MAPRSIFNIWLIFMSTEPILDTVSNLSYSIRIAFVHTALKYPFSPLDIKQKKTVESQYSWTRTSMDGFNS